MNRAAKRAAASAQKRRLRLAGQRNNCGGCDACCTSVAVGALEKPHGVRCEHQNGAGCAVYDQRPYECQRFRCLWLALGWAPALRPDRIGVVVVQQAKPVEGCELQAYRVGPDGFERGRELLVKLTRDMGAVMLVGDIEGGEVVCQKMERTG